MIRLNQENTVKETCSLLDLNKLEVKWFDLRYPKGQEAAKDFFLDSCIKEESNCGKHSSMAKKISLNVKPYIFLHDHCERTIRHQSAGLHYDNRSNQMRFVVTGKIFGQEEHL